MRLFSNITHLKLISTVAGTLALLSLPTAASASTARLVRPSDAIAKDSPKDAQLSQLEPADAAEPAIEAGIPNLDLPSAVDGLIETDDNIPPTYFEPGTSEGTVDETIIRDVPSAFPPLPSDAEILGEELTLRIAPAEEPTVAADNRSTIRLVGTIADAAGNPVNQDVVVTLTSSAGEFVDADYDIDRGGFQVLARQGQFEAELRSSLEAQRVIVRASADAREALGLEDNESAQLPTAELQDYTQISFITALRPSLVTGLVDFRLGPAGTNLWGSFRDFLDPDLIDETEFDLDASLFATGSFGDWLMTAAFNSERALNERCDGNRLYRDVQFCEQAYPVYGDSSTTDFLTPSIDSFYVRFQRDALIPDADPDYFMWGDYDTAEFARFSQEFSAITRQLHGFKGNYTFGNGLQLTALYANNVRPFQRDTIAPDGTSGFYFLSRRLILPGSEDIFIEVEELNRPGTVVERVRLSRGADYQIDYDRGSILFNQPVTLVDANPFGPALVRRIVATYQVEGDDSDGSLFGGRAQYNFSYDLDAPSWIGATLLIEDQGARDFSLYGFDALVSLGETGRIVAEAAFSSLDDGFGESDGSAFRVEATGEITPDIAGTAYYRTAESGFRNNASTSFRPGQTRWGGQLGANLGDSTQLQFQVDQEINRGETSDIITDPEILFNPGLGLISGPSVDNTLTTIRAGVQQQLGVLTANVDWVHRNRKDRILDDTINSDQLVAGLAWPLAENLTFRAETDITLSDEDDPVYPGQTVFGLDWDVMPELTVRLAHRFFHDDDVTPDAITTLDTLLNYDLAEHTTLTGRYSLLGGFNGMTGQGAIGLNHRWVVSSGLHVDLGVERIFGNSLSLLSSGAQFLQPYAVGQTAAALGLVDGTTYTVGIEYTDNPNFQASARFEHRDSDNGSNTLLTASAAGKLSPALTTLARFQYGNYANQTITGRLANTSSLRVGLAYRNPASDKFNGLLSYEYAVNPSSTPNSILLGAGSNSIEEHTLSAEAIYAPNWQWEFYGKYALRSTNADLDSLGVGLTNTIHLAQLRAAYRFAYRWDVVGEARYISQPSADYDEWGWAIEAGYYMTPDLRLGVGYSFGSADDRSFIGSGYRSDSGPYLAVTLKVNELLNQFGLQEVAPVQQEESLIEASAAEPTALTTEATTEAIGGGIEE
ncbi:MAG: TonB-dependent receptor [Leptolyngbya sp. SIO4C1]|nr:TonB-dependent receptor [Leptolyngbya sp. SIO4C1]